MTKVRSFFQGYCQPHEWLNFDSNWNPICEPNKCLSRYNDIMASSKDVPYNGARSTFVEYVPYGDQNCTLLGRSCSKYEETDANNVSQNELMWSSLNHLSHTVQFEPGFLQPKCAPAKLVKWEYPTPKLQCLPGSLLAVKSLQDGFFCQYHSVYER